MSAGSTSASIVGIIDAVFRVALQRQTEEIRFLVRDDDFLDIRMRTEDTWTELPPLVCTGSALSRLFVIGHLEKGADARSKPQTASATILGRPMVFETEPVRPWREHVRVLIGADVQ